MIQEKPIVFFDLETTGLDLNNDRIVEIALLKRDSEGLETILHHYVNPEMDIPEAATEIHGITNERVAPEPTFSELAHQILSFLANCDIAGYNIYNFDLPILFAEFQRAGIKWKYLDHNFIDVCNIYRRMSPHTLEEAVKFFTGEALIGAHSALEDTKATARVFNAQIEKYKGLPEYQQALATFSNYDKSVLDLSGKFTKDTDGEVVFTFGKHQGKKVKDNLDYVKWMLGADFPADTKYICEMIIKKFGSK